tara:strand:+ start:1095 stop:1685 length:591 start_codon:yes stop_codon:yes gene_type:complete
MIVDYYKVLDLKSNCTKEEIRKRYKELCIIYHPDKNNGGNEDFIKIKEAYDNLYDDELRKKHNIYLIFGDIQFTEEDYLLLNKYYTNIINSKEFRLMKLMYKSIPDRIKKDIWRKFKGIHNNQIVKAHKSIDITKLFNDVVINLCINREEFINRTLKVIIIISNNGIYYLYLRGQIDKIIIDNLNCYLSLNFFIND